MYNLEIMLKLKNKTKNKQTLSKYQFSYLHYGRNIDYKDDTFKAIFKNKLTPVKKSTIRLVLALQKSNREKVDRLSPKSFGC